MSNTPMFRSASPYQDDVLALPVTDLDAASEWYCRHFGMTEVRRTAGPAAVILERDGVQIGFAVNGGDAAQDGASVLVTGIEQLRNDLAATDTSVGDFRIDDHDGQKMKVFFVVAPDGLCFYFYEPIDP